MIYEVYFDSLFLLNMGMNLFLLELTNCILHYKAAWKRIFMGALCGSLCSVLVIVIPGELVITGSVGFLLSVLSMSRITFKTANIRAYLHLLEVLSGLTIVLGAVLQYVLSRFLKKGQMSVLFVLLVGAICFLVLHRLFQRGSKEYECKVTLRNNKSQIKISALVDTGNSLIEPISGLPVAVLDKKVFDSLFIKDKPGGFRVIPYHSLDKKTGLLPGYLIPEMRVEWKGLCRDYHNVYVGVRQQNMEDANNYKMIINPEMLKERKAG